MLSIIKIELKLNLNKSNLHKFYVEWLDFPTLPWTMDLGLPDPLTLIQPRTPDKTPTPRPWIDSPCGNFLNIFGGHNSFPWGHWCPRFGFLVMSAMGFKARVDASLMCFLTYVQWIPQIHLWWDTCWPLCSQHGSQSFLIHMQQLSTPSHSAIQGSATCKTRKSSCGKLYKAYPSTQVLARGYPSPGRGVPQSCPKGRWDHIVGYLPGYEQTETLPCPYFGCGKY